MTELLGRLRQDPEQELRLRELVQRRNLIESLRGLREQLGKTQAEVAAAMGSGQSTVSELETEQTDPRLSTLQRYARATGHRFEFRVVPEGLEVPWWFDATHVPSSGAGIQVVVGNAGISYRPWSSGGSPGYALEALGG